MSPDDEGLLDGEEPTTMDELLRLSSLSTGTDTTESSDENNYHDTWLETETMEELIHGTVFLDEVIAEGDQVVASLASPRQERRRAKTYSMSSTTSSCSCGSFSAKERCLSDLSSSMDYSYLQTPALDVRVVSTATIGGQILYTIRAEDACNSWTVHKSYKELHGLYKQIKAVSMSPIEVPFWGTMHSLRKCRVPKRLFQLQSKKSITRQRMVIMDSFLRQIASVVAPTPLGPQRQEVLNLLHAFIGIGSSDTPRVPYSRPLPHTLSSACLVHGEKGPPVGQIHAKVAAVVETYEGACDDFVADFIAKASPFYFAPVKSTLLQKRSSAQTTGISKDHAGLLLDCIKEKLREMQRTVLSHDDIHAFLAETKAHLDANDLDTYDDLVVHVRRDVSCHLQKRIFVALEDHITECVRALVSEANEEEMLRKMRTLAKKPQTAFGVKANLSGDDWHHARLELQAMDMCTLPSDKLKCIMNSATAIFQSVVEANSDDFICSSRSIRGVSLSADDFVPIYIYVVVSSLLATPLATKELLSLICDAQEDAGGKVGYYFTNFVAAVEHVKALPA
ncbi:hypothetical protein SPRG_07235 [Saprolegnia parasitica CBS 223.65]|uniref:VPS9 domain-containing protein n=1 Tax=Saprolegnia parasitica (strain CBS 223.65) TaxID=695850 RepID=A0A067CB04_SAPPC|nr:hypothetical protein SPRG_07235 [Saprolegnia parasitica CBS 223.65]KDO27959.1 hypothetical protein SPRG_07235 [Saprolegnia parasitica CBS 223.65]|eukprot:XP_012201409.1 hypothetical protein SPRG_07235 [Saprolegnia parasitica CBS 223.65]